MYFENCKKKFNFYFGKQAHLELQKYYVKRKDKIYKKEKSIRK